ncbi:MAG: hypothetical protein RJB58_2489 [Pseudomonadota bacterium]|jgi:hypothetical protein
MPKGPQGQTVPEQVFGYLKSAAPHFQCDDCIAGVLHISPRNQINPITSAFGLTRDFRRVKDRCTVCDKVKLVTRYER